MTSDDFESAVLWRDGRKLKDNKTTKGIIITPENQKRHGRGLVSQAGMVNIELQTLTPKYAHARTSGVA